MKADNPELIVDRIIDKAGKNLVVGTPLAAGKPNHLLNALYNRARNNPDLQLKIFTALTLDRPKGNSLLERRFLEPMVERVFGDYPDLDYEQDRQTGRLPPNVDIIEFYFPAGKYLDNDYAQQNYICSNYTHVARDMMDAGVNVLLQMVSPGTFEGRECYSLSSNPDVTLDLIDLMQKRYSVDGTPFALAAQVNRNLPFMLGDALVNRDTFDFVLENSDLEYRIFAPPKMAVSERDFLIGLYLSTLIRDGGELQVGIGAIGDALVYALLLRHQQNDVYQALLKDFGIIDKFGAIIDRIGGTEPFTEGLFAASEMIVDGFMELFEAGIIKRRVYDDLVIQRLINEGSIDETVTPETLDLILMRKGIRQSISEADFDYLQKFGIFRRSLSFADGEISTPEGEKIPGDLDDLDNRQRIYELCLGDRLANADVIHGGFFLAEKSERPGPQFDQHEKRAKYQSTLRARGNRPAASKRCALRQHLHDDDAERLGGQRRSRRQSRDQRGRRAVQLRCHGACAARRAFHSQPAQYADHRQGRDFDYRLELRAYDHTAAFARPGGHRVWHRQPARQNRPGSHAATTGDHRFPLPAGTPRYRQQAR